jgi:hypothetical protein
MYLQGKTKMANKKLQQESKYEKYDLNGDGIVTDAEFEMDQKLIRLENEDKKEDAQRHMAWFALSGMLLYPLAMIISAIADLQSAVDALSDIAPTYFVSVAALVAAFFGKEAYVKSKDASASVKKEEKW